MPKALSLPITKQNGFSFSSIYIPRSHYFCLFFSIRLYNEYLNNLKARLIFFFFLNGCADDSKDLLQDISGQFQLFAGCCNSWFSYRDPAVGARVPSQPVVVVGEMTVWIVSHKPWCAGHLLMETNETKTRMRNELKRGKHRNEKWSAYGMQKQPEFKQAMMCCNCSFFHWKTSLQVVLFFLSLSVSLRGQWCLYVWMCVCLSG